MTTIDERASPSDRGTSRALLATSLVVSAFGLAWAYASSFATLVDRWSRDDNYSHGFFVLPIAAIILWQRRGRLDGLALAPSWWGVVSLVALLAARAWLFERNDQWLEVGHDPSGRRLAWPWPWAVEGCSAGPGRRSRSPASCSRCRCG